MWGQHIDLHPHAPPWPLHAVAGPPTMANDRSTYLDVYDLSLKKWAFPGLFSFIFSLFKQTTQFLQQINANKCPSGIWQWDSNQRPHKHELSPITTRPGLPPHYDL